MSTAFRTKKTDKDAKLRLPVIDNQGYLTNGKVYSPYYRKNYNPFFPNGVTEDMNAKMHKASVILLPKKKDVKIIRLSREKETIKACVNKGKLTTVFKGLGIPDLKDLIQSS